MRKCMRRMCLTTPLFFVLVLAGCTNRAEQSRQNMHKIQLAILEHALENGNEWPDSIDEAKDKIRGATLAEVLKNPDTGDDPGYEYVKPKIKPNVAGYGSQVMLYQLRNGKRDTTLKVGFAAAKVDFIESK